MVSLFSFHTIFPPSRLKVTAGDLMNRTAITKIRPLPPFFSDTGGFFSDWRYCKIPTTTTTFPSSVYVKKNENWTHWVVTPHAISPCHHLVFLRQAESAPTLRWLLRLRRRERQSERHVIMCNHLRFSNHYRPLSGFLECCRSIGGRRVSLGR